MLFSITIHARERFKERFSSKYKIDWNSSGEIEIAMRKSLDKAEESKQFKNNTTFLIKAQERHGYGPMELWVNQEEGVVFVVRPGENTRTVVTCVPQSTFNLVETKKKKADKKPGVNDARRPKRKSKMGNEYLAMQEYLAEQDHLSSTTPRLKI